MTFDRASVNRGGKSQDGSSPVGGMPGKQTLTEQLLDEMPVQRKSAGANPAAVSPTVGNGRSLPQQLQAKMERSLGADFSAVRIHEGPQAQALGALAYTQGNDIHFAPGQYQPESRQGQELLGHELAHVVQQSQGRVQATKQAKGAAINDDPALEREADEMGARAAQGEVTTPHASVINRSPASGTGKDIVQQKCATCDEKPSAELASPGQAATGLPRLDLSPKGGGGQTGEKASNANVDAAAKKLAATLVGAEVAEQAGECETCDAPGAQEAQAQAKLEAGADEVKAQDTGLLQMKSGVIQLHTKADCDDWYEQCNEGCRRLPNRTRADKARRALCWSGCMAEYATCLASSTEALTFAAIVAAIVLAAADGPLPIGDAAAAALLLSLGILPN